MAVRVRGVRPTLAAVRKATEITGNAEIRSKSLQAFADVKLANPVLTGRSRNSWTITFDRALFQDAGEGGQVGAQTLGFRPEFDSIHIANGTPYIADVNRSEAHMMFIEQSIHRYFPDSEITIEEVDNGN